MNALKIMNETADKAVEKKVADFLDENFYSVLSSRVPVFGRAADVESQVLGIDLSVGNSLWDEKVKNASSPNQIGDYWASVEIYHEWKNGEWHEGWFVDKKVQTTHYAYLYNYEDGSGETSSVIMALFSKKELQRAIESFTSLEQITQDASKMHYAKKHVDDKTYFDPLNGKLKLTKSREGSAVLCTRLSDIACLPSSRFIRITKGKRIKKISFSEIKQLFSKGK